MIKIFYKTIKEKRLAEIEDFRAGAWINAESPSEQELSLLSKKLGLDKNLLKDALDPREVPRLEVQGKTTYIFTRVPCQKKEETATSPLLIALSEKFILTLSASRIEALDIFIKDRVDFFTSQRTKFLIQMFFAINNEFSKSITLINKEVRGTRVNLEKISNRDIVQLINFEETLNDFLSALIPTSSLLQKLLAGGYLALYEEDKELIEDLFLENNQLIEFCKSTLKTIVNIRDAYSTIMTHNLNRVIKLLTALTIILTIPTIISSIYGMNVRLPLQESPLAFLWVMGATATISLLVLIIFAKNKWL